MKRYKKKKKICFVTSTRADYGLLKTLIRQSQESKKFSSKLIVCGSHGIKKFGNSYTEIENDKIKIFKSISLNLTNDQPEDISNFFVRISQEINKIFKENYFDAVVILGDRFEMLSIASIATIYNIPIIHIHGGESTEGIIDNSIRHAITKLASLHFTSHQQYKKKLEQMGEQPKNIFCFGGLGASNIKEMNLLSKSLVERKLRISLLKKTLLITLHPLTLDNSNTKSHFLNLLDSLKNFKNLQFVFTAPNLEVNHNDIFNLIKSFVKSHDNAYFYASLGTEMYYSLLNHCAGVVGNSSSGILEAPSFKVGTINIGNRQGGRIQAKSIINCAPVSKEITKSIKKLLSAKFKDRLKSLKNPYYKKNTVHNILRIILKKDLTNINKKKF